MYNYLLQLKAFRIHRKLSQLGSSAIALWYALSGIANEVGRRDQLTLSLSTLAEESGMSVDQVLRTRNILQQKGYLNYVSRTGRQSAVYSLTDLAVQFVPQIAAQPVAQNVVQPVVQPVAQNVVQPVVQLPDIYLQDNTIQDKDTGTTCRAREADVGDKGEATAGAYLQGNGVMLTSAHYDELREFLTSGISDDMIHLAVDEAVANGARAWSYVRAILNRWLTCRIGTVQAAKADLAANKARRSAAREGRQANSGAKPAATRDYGPGTDLDWLLGQEGGTPS